MGKKAVEIFQEAEKLGGLSAKAQLAAHARITSTEASSIEDSPELLNRLTQAMMAVRAARASSAASAAEGKIVASGSGATEAELLRKQMQTVAELMSQRSLFLGDVEKTVRRIDEAATDALDIERVSVWVLDDARSKITCLDLFERKPGKHSSGVELFRKDFEPYFKALLAERTIAAHDAHRDPRTSCFSAPYLKPLAIESMLDVPIWVRGDMKGVICHEHIGRPRRWTSDEESFAYLLSTIVALSMERRG